MVQNPFDNIAVRKSIEPLGNFKDTFPFFSGNTGIQSFLIFGDICIFFLKDMGYLKKKKLIMGYGILYHFRIPFPKSRIG